MIKTRFAAFTTAAMIGVAAMPAMPVMANGTDLGAAYSTEPVFTQQEMQDGNESENTESQGTSDTIPVPVSGDAGRITKLLADLDEETLEVLLENPKLMSYFLPLLHVTVTDGSVKIAVDGSEEEDGTMSGRVQTRGRNLNVRTGPGVGYDIITSLPNGTEIKIMGESNGWYQLEQPSKNGYVAGNYVVLNQLPSGKEEEGYSFDIDGEMMAEFLSAFSGLFEGDPVTEIHGLTPDGNLSLVDDYGNPTGEGQQFITLVTKAGNYFYLIIDRNEKGEETVHFLNMVDERDLLTLMEDDDTATYQEKLAEEQAAREAAEKAAEEAAQAAAEAERARQEEQKGTNMLPLILVLVVLAAAGGGWFYLQTRKKKQASNTPDPDADYEDEEDEEEDYGAGEPGDEEDVISEEDNVEGDL